jgi:hypothetical protein
MLERLLYADMAAKLRRIVTPTLVLELNIARLRGELTRSTPTERFAEYIERLRQPTVRQALRAGNRQQEQQPDQQLQHSRNPSF